MANQPEVYDRHLSISMDSEIIRFKRSLWCAFRADIDVLENVSLAHRHAGGSRIDHIVGKEFLKNFRIVLGNVRQKIADKLGDLLAYWVLRTRGRLCLCQGHHRQ